MDPDLRVVVASHKPYWVPDDPCYLPVWSGSASAEASIPASFQRDDEGENISSMSWGYCEMSALYWAWRNLPAKHLGLVHYRRYFGLPGSFGDKRSRIIPGEALLEILGRTPIVLPRQRRYWIESGWSHYAHAHHEQDLEITRKLLSERHPGCVATFDEVLGRTHAHRFNMFAMRRDLADEYCSWIFPLLSELEERIDLTGYSAADRRVYGYMSERLLDVWVESRGLGYTELPVVFLESQHWPKKAASFLARKFFPKR